MVESNFDTIKIVYAIFTIIIDILVHLALQLIATKGPGSETKNKNKNKTHHRAPSTAKEDDEKYDDDQSVDDINIEYDNEPFQTQAYDFLFTAQYPIISNKDIENAIFENVNEADSNYFVDTTAMRIFSNCTCYKYLKYSMQLWAFCCGFLAIYLSLVFWINLVAEFVFASIGRSGTDPGSIFALVAAYFLVEIIFFCVRRQVESIALLTRNVGDMFDVKIILLWRIYDVCFVIICTGCSRIDSSVWFFQTLMLLMVIRGSIWQIVHTLIAFLATVGIVLYQFTNAIDGFKQENEWLNWKEFMFVITDRPESMSECTWYKYGYVVCVWLLMIIFFAMMPIYKELFAFCGLIMIIYYLLILFDSAKYNTWYSLWSGKFHSQYFGYKTTANDDINCDAVEQQQQDIELVAASGKYQKVSVFEEDAKETKDEYEYKTDPMQTTANVVTTTDSMVFLDFWERVDYKYNHYMCSCCWCMHCDKCPPTTPDTIICCRAFGIGLLKWICLIFFLLITFLTVWYWLQPEPAAKNPPHFTTNHVGSYEVCHTAWAQSYITIVDFIYLAKAASFINWEGEIENEAVLTQFDLWFGNETESGWDYSTLYIHPQPGFFHIKNEKQEIDLLINRPSATNMDLIQDLRLYGEAGLFHLFSYAIPLSDLLPVSFIREFIAFASIPERLLSPTLHREYDDVVYNYVTSHIANNTKSKYFVQGGHSLGAGLTDIVGARLYHNGYGDNINNFSIINFGLGSPGTLWSSKKFGYSTEDLDKSTSIHLKARRDLIASLVDIHGGNGQEIRCIQPNTMSCHFSTNYFCEMYRSCNTINAQTGENMFRNKTFTKCVCEDKFDFKYCW